MPAVSPPLQHSVHEGAQTGHEDHEAEHFHRFDQRIAKDPALVEVTEFDPQRRQEVAGIADGAIEGEQQMRGENEEMNGHVEDCPAHSEAVKAIQGPRERCAADNHHSHEEDGVEEDKE